MKNVNKHRDITLVTNEARRNYLEWEPKYHTTNFSPEKSLTMKMIQKPQIFMNKSVYLGLSFLK